MVGVPLIIVMMMILRTLSVGVRLLMIGMGHGLWHRHGDQSGHTGGERKQRTGRNQGGHH